MFSSNTSAVSADANYIEDVFSTWLYTGNGSTQTITNGVDLSTKGGLVWTKRRNGGASGHRLVDTVRGAGNTIYSNLTNAAATEANGVTGFTSSGYSLGTDTAYNFDTYNFVSWTFREQAKFFDVVTYTGNGSNRTIAHNLGSVPGCIFVKRRDAAADWQVYHRSIGNTKYLLLNTADGEATNSNRWNNTTPTSTDFALGTSADVNANGGTYVAYLFAHDAGGFGLTGTDNVITCGSFTTDSGGAASVTLGYEPQFLLVKRATGGTGNWYLLDTMRGMNLTDNAELYSNSNAEEFVETLNYDPTATGFGVRFQNASSTYIYIAIRRGPMKTPTTGTSVFTTNTYTGTGAARTITTGFVTDLVFGHGRTNDISGTAVADRLRGDTKYLETTSTAAETTSDGASQDITGFDLQTGYTLGVPNNSWMNNNGSPGVNWAWRRAPSFFDVVCYTGTGSATTVAHNLGVVPELILVKRRDATFAGRVYSATLGNTKFLQLFSATGNAAEANTGAGSNGEWNATTPTSSVFSVGAVSATNGSGFTFVAYLFASCPGVSKVGSYTGTGATLQIDCGFTGGARFVLIKRTDSTGDWYVWDSARGIVSGNDPFLLLNSTSSEVPNTDYVDTYSAGFEISSTAPAAINANGGTFVFLAVA